MSGKGTRCIADGPAATFEGVGTSFEIKGFYIELD